MVLRPLGATALRVSPIGLGTVKLGRDRGLKYPAPVRIPTDDEALTLLRTAHELGINLIDTAPAYGIAEERLGTLLPQVAPRDRWLLCTKCGEVFDPATATSAYNFHPAYLRLSIERSLRRLRTDALDIALLHFASSDDTDARVLRNGAALATLRDLQHEGKLRAVGVSVGTPAGGLLAVDAADVVMCTLNPHDRSHLPVIEAAAARNRGILIKKPLASGKADPADSLKFILATPGVASAIIGTANPANLRAAAGLAAGR